jgi:hypothetical protein
MKSMPQGWTTVNTQGCIKERPDFIFDLGDKMMVVEVDEHKHRGRAQARGPRMFNVGQVAVGGAPVMF